MNRREFMAAGAATLGSAFVNRGWAGQIAPNSRLCHACVGVGGMGWGDLQSIGSHKAVQIVALCDVDKGCLENARKAFPEARLYTDWREMLAKEGDKIDSVNVSTPDHMHASISYSALKAGKNVYNQKPLCHDIGECRALLQAAKDSGKVTQLGTQFAAMLGDRMAVAYLRKGVLGTVKRILLLCTCKSNNRPLGPRPEKGETPPASLAWDLWLGTAPARVFALGLYHHCRWRGWQDFGTSILGDNASHVLDSSWKALDLQEPLSVRAEVEQAWMDSPERRADVWPQSQHVTWKLPGTKLSGGAEITLEWFDGTYKPEPNVQAFAKLCGRDALPEIGSIIIGTEGFMLMQHNTAPRFIGKDNKPMALPKLDLPPVPSHYHAFVNACLGGAKAESPFTRIASMTDTILLGPVAVREAGKELAWDAKTCRVTNCDDANKHLGRVYRKGWNIPALEKKDTIAVVGDGFVPVFNGGDLTGWTGRTDLYEVGNGVLYSKKTGAGNLMLAKQYGDFVLRFDFLLEKGGNNGVMVRMSEILGGGSACGMELQILDDDDPQYKGLKDYQYNGSLYGVCPAKRGFLRSVGEWNHEEVRAEGPRITVILNGATIMDCDLSKVTTPMDGRSHPHLHNPSGYLGFMAHHSRVGFRNIQLKA